MTIEEILAGESKNVEFKEADGDTSLIPDNRTYKLVFERRTEAAAGNSPIILTFVHAIP